MSMNPPSIAELTDINHMVDFTGYTALNLAVQYPKVKVPDGTQAMFFDIKEKALVRVDTDEICHQYSIRTKEWTRTKPISSLGYWLKMRNKGLRPVIF